MELLVLDKNFIAQKVIDGYESLIWTDRYNQYGDFELYIPMDMGLLEHLKRGNYLIQRDSNHGMIVEKIQIDFDADTGTHLIVTGRSLESLLDRRIIWDQTRLRGKFHTCIKKILDESIINPSDKNRQIVNFLYEETNDDRIKDISIDKQFSGDNLYESIILLCKQYGIGFKIRLDGGRFIFNLYKGKDRSYDQLNNPYVIFSPNFENLISSKYYETSKDEKNVALIAGEDTELGEGRRTYIIGNTVGLDRREMFVDARDIQSEGYDEEGNEVIMPDSEYMDLLKARGEEKMLAYKFVTEFSGQAETSRMFRHNEDFFIGDVVQVEDGWGHFNKARVAEIIFSQSGAGYSIHPTFEVVEEGVI